MLCLSLIAVFGACSAPGPEISQADEDEGGIYLAVAEDSYPLDTAAIPYRLVNDTDHDIWMQMIPRLELWTEQGWQELAPVDVGFCGTPDRIESGWADELPLSWYEGQIVPGRYRLSFDLVTNGQDYTVTAKLAADFELV